MSLEHKFPKSSQPHLWGCNLEHNMHSTNIRIKQLANQHMVKPILCKQRSRTAALSMTGRTGNVWPLNVVPNRKICKPQYRNHWLGFCQNRSDDRVPLKVPIIYILLSLTLLTAISSRFVASSRFSNHYLLFHLYKQNKHI